MKTKLPSEEIEELLTDNLSEYSEWNEPLNIPKKTEWEKAIIEFLDERFKNQQKIIQKSYESTISEK